ncbi:MAG TPA: IS1595 family transposase [Pseudolabrys sp.]|nr:IS1595 family transposase [Pseudolabrys sp.]
MKYTVQQFQAEYPNDDICLEKLMEVQHGGTEITCPACDVEGAKFHLMRKRKAFACQECGHHVYPCAGTIFHKSRTPLTKWFLAMYLMTSTRSGVAAKELERALGVTYKCAWRMAHELRKLMASADYAGPLGGSGKHVEVDETLIGGAARRHGKGKGRRAKKTIVMGMVERDGMLRTGPVPDDKNFTLEPIILENVASNTIVTTDGHTSYQDLGRSYEHGVVKHSENEYVVGIHHTNTIEGHWSHFKRAVKGTHVHISPKHLWKYCAEFNYRRNFRQSHVGMFNRLVSAFALPRLAET